MNPPSSSTDYRQARAQRRTRLARRGALCGALFGFTGSLLVGLSRHAPLSPVLPIALALLVALTLALGIWQTEGAWLIVHDELEQKIRSDASAVAFPLTLAVLLFLGALDALGLRWVPPVCYWLPPLAIYAAALVWSKRRYS